MRTNVDYTEAKDSEWPWHQLGHMQICTSPQTDNHATMLQLQPFYGPLDCVWDYLGEPVPFWYWLTYRKVKPIWIYWSKK